MTTVKKQNTSKIPFSVNWDMFVQDHIRRSWALTIWLVVLAILTLNLVITQLEATPVTTVIVLIVWIATVSATVFAEVTHQHNRVTRWTNRNLYNSITNIMISLIIVLSLIWAAQTFFRYAVTTSTFSRIPPTQLRGEFLSADSSEVCFEMGRRFSDEFPTLIRNGEQRCFATDTYVPTRSATPLSEIAAGGAQVCFDEIPDDPDNGITCFENEADAERSTFFIATEEYSGANWGAVLANMRIMMVFSFRADELWRVWAVLGMIGLLAVPSLFVYRDSYTVKPVRRALTILWFLTPIFTFVLLRGVPATPYPLDEGTGTIVSGFFEEAFTKKPYWETLEEGAEVDFLGSPAIIGEDVSAFTYVDNEYRGRPVDLFIEELKVNIFRFATLIFLPILAVAIFVNRRYPAKDRERDLVIFGRGVLRIALIIFGIMAALYALQVFFLFLGSLHTNGEQLLPAIDPDQNWGGFLLTLLITIFAIVVSFPIGIVLALGRRSKIRGIPVWLTWPVAIGGTIYLLYTNTPTNLELARSTTEEIMAFWPLLLPVLAYGFHRYFDGNVVAAFSTLFIEFVRGIPFIAVLFLTIILFPILLPKDAEILGVYRVMVGGALFAAAYLAENVRGGLQSIPKGQYEAADSLGLSTVAKYRLIILPQALRVVIPAIVGQFIGLFKDTTLVAIIGLFDILGVANTISAQADWLGVRDEAYIFLLALYFVGSSVMSIYSRRLEKRYGLGER